ncbi:MAG: hypothetical protein JSV91_07590 [Phycisphaerales bacterium]|nr:MAG: hypothetical protein JSV91_07590 [Phycisphaerales bacterium]
MSATSEDRTRCLLLTTDSDAVEESLHSRLKSRNWLVSVQQDPHVAMAELCLREWSQTTRAAWGLKRQEHMVLAIVTPSRQPPFGDDLDALLAAVRRYLPSTPIWLYSEGQLQPLGIKVEASETEEDESPLPAAPEEAVEITGPPPPGPGCTAAESRFGGVLAREADRLKLADVSEPKPPDSPACGEPSEPDLSHARSADGEVVESPAEMDPEPVDGGETDEPDDRTVLSREEIDMLLGTDEGEGTP